MLVKFPKRSKINSYVICLNCKFYSLKLCIKNNFIGHIVNNIRLAQNLTHVLKA